MLRMTDPRTVVLDVTGRVPIDGSHHISTWVFTPDALEGPVPLLLCLPGGSYSKAYWHLEVPGRSDYSFAAHLADAGMVVVAVDHIGTGDSSRHPRGIELTPEVMAAANAAAFTDTVERARSGTLLEGLPPLTLGPTVGVGHSMGAMLAIFQPSLFGSFDAIAPLGYGTVGPITDPDVSGDGVSLLSRESVMAAAAQGAFDDIPLLDRTTPAIRHHFYWDDVPDDVMAADDLTNTTVPGVCGPLSVVPFVASDHAGRARCPVFIGLGERDSTPSHYDEARAYFSSNDITLYVLPGSGHCHNTAGTRHVLWNRLARWIGALPR